MRKSNKWTKEYALEGLQERIDRISLAYQKDRIKLYKPLKYTK